jgi:hypothetical protein
MARGGKRPGAGRKKGSPNKKKVAAKAPIRPKAPSVPMVQATVPPRLTVDWVASADPSELCKRGRGIILSLMAELEFVSSHTEEIEDDIYTETGEDKSPLRRQAMMRAVSLPTRASTAKNLSAALRGLAEAAPGKRKQASERAKEVATDRLATPAGPRLVTEGGKIVGKD